MARENIEAVCFDLDGTLSEADSWLVLTEGLGCCWQEVLDIFQEYQKGKITFSQCKERLTTIYQASKKATKSFISQLFNKVELKEKASETISYLKEQGYRIYLVSGAPSIYVGIVAQKLEVDGFRASSFLIFDPEKETLQEVHWLENQGRVKVEQLQRMSQILKITMKQIAFVGNGRNDIEAFEATGRGIAVRGAVQELNQVAWKTIEDLTEIKSILKKEY
jgi:HAD superfamily phosphoserine phosphatase-like hydrolase